MTTKQEIDTIHCAENPEEVSLHPPEECSDYGRPMKHTEESPPPVTPPPVNAFEDTPFTLSPSPSPTLLEIVEHKKEIQRAVTDSFLDFKDQTKAIRRAGSMSFTPAPQRRPPKSPKQRRAPSPPASSPCLPQSSKPKQSAN
ncbi:hypothetical protein CgunFtcFv8_007716 [Champsocephalus gunnari]|uniref:Uncharacterized protein n=1 Tax=Champsocephalus gunnari TaxID=52237 RepID=A0AAN8CI02_CHAGU|nr:hypothetical protein CgunFtcFv8_007716 [Champsocephalus gunnari]